MQRIQFPYIVLVKVRGQIAIHCVEVKNQPSAIVKGLDTCHYVTTPGFLCNGRDWRPEQEPFAKFPSRSRPSSKWTGSDCKQIQERSNEE